VHGIVPRAILPTTGADIARRAIPREETGHILLITRGIDPGHTLPTTGGTDPDRTLRITAAEGRDPDPGPGPHTVVTAGLQLEGVADPTPVTQGHILLNAQFRPTIIVAITGLFPAACRQGEVHQ